MSGLRWGLGLLAAGLFLALALIAPAGLPDAQLFGYSAAEVDAWALDARGVELAEGPVFLLDLVFPAIMAAFLLLVLPRWALVLPLVYAGLDYSENALLQRYYDGLSAGQPLSPWASPLTQGKWAALGLAFAVLLGMWLWRRRAHSGH